MKCVPTSLGLNVVAVEVDPMEEVEVGLMEAVVVGPTVEAAALMQPKWSIA